MMRHIDREFALFKTVCSILKSGVIGWQLNADKSWIFLEGRQFLAKMIQSHFAIYPSSLKVFSHLSYEKCIEITFP